MTAAITAEQAIAATAAGEQNDQNDDPPAAVAAHTVVTHKPYLHEIFRAALLPLIPWYDTGQKRCGFTPCPFWRKGFSAASLYRLRTGQR